MPQTGISHAVGHRWFESLVYQLMRYKDDGDGDSDSIMTSASDEIRNTAMSSLPSAIESYRDSRLNSTAGSNFAVEGPETELMDFLSSQAGRPIGRLAFAYLGARLRAIRRRMQSSLRREAVRYYLVMIAFEQILIINRNEILNDDQERIDIEREQLVKRITDSIDARDNLIRTIEMDTPRYESHKAAMDRAFEEHSQAKASGAVAEMDRTLNKLFHSTRIAACTLLKQSRSCKAYEKAHNEGADAAYTLTCGPHWCEHALVEGFTTPQTDCVTVLEDLKIEDYGDSTRQRLDYGRRLAMRLQAFLEDQKPLLALGRWWVMKLSGQDADALEITDDMVEATLQRLLTEAAVATN